MTHLFKPFWKGTKDLYICVSDFKKQERDIPRELHCQMLSQQLFGKHLQIYWEFIQELQIVLSTLKESNLSVLLRKSIVIKRLIVSWIVSFLNTRESDSLGVQKLKKDFYKDNGESQVGCLRTGRRHVREVVEPV